MRTSTSPRPAPRARGPCSTNAASLLLHDQRADLGLMPSVSMPACSAVLEHRPRDHLGVGRRRVLEAVEVPVLGSQGVGRLTRDRAEEVGQEPGMGGRGGVDELARTGAAPSPSPMAAFKSAMNANSKSMSAREPMLPWLPDR